MGCGRSAYQPTVAQALIGVGGAGEGLGEGEKASSLFWLVGSGLLSEESLYLGNLAEEVVQLA